MKRVDRLSRSSSAAAACRRFRRCRSRRRTSASASLAHCCGVSICSVRLANVVFRRLLAWAPEDRAFKVEFARRLAAAFPEARLELVPDSYTFVAEDQPERLGQLIAEFVREPYPATQEEGTTPAGTSPGNSGTSARA